MNKQRYYFWLGVLLLLSLGGLLAWIYQVANGLVVTGMRNIVSWGLYISAFMFLVGLSAGGLIVSSSATVFNIRQFKPAAKPAILLSAVCIIMAVMFIFVDLGRPDRFFNLLLTPKFNSPLIWDVVVIAVYLAISLYYLWLTSRPKLEENRYRVISALALPVAILVHSVTAWIFGLQIARPTWHSALLAPLFVVSALDSGLALLLVVLIILDRLGWYKLEKELLATLGGLLAVLIAVDVFFIFSEVLTALYPAEERLMKYINLLLIGSLAPFFWGEIVLAAVPFLILVFRSNRERKSLVGLAASLVVVGVFCKRIWLLFSALMLPLIPYGPGVTLGSYALPPGEFSRYYPRVWSTAGQYVPTWVELLIFTGIFAFGALLYILAARIILAEGPGEQKAPVTGDELKVIA
ncbi:Polysulfide reductase, NrfD [Neomoorella glycerini]|uniref:Polysulfide reductase, NrfD n=1 Tax=Neomoorella glycerini TaxID=55779 RepID=A0A6I5ZU95_9FIRM|nr:NrfD/PsrC family molybdoenzyme membrane anchor subunit [Moorella glycerini]QGP93107.1 Polysulfide reductase, NrfD [Moorella glycerini]